MLFSGYCYLYLIPLVSSWFVSKNAGAGAKIEKFYFPNYAQYRGEGGFDHSRNSFKIFSPLPVDPSEFWCRWPLLKKKRTLFSCRKKEEATTAGSKDLFLFCFVPPLLSPAGNLSPEK